MRNRGLTKAGRPRKRRRRLKALSLPSPEFIAANGAGRWNLDINKLAREFPTIAALAARMMLDTLMIKRAKRDSAWLAAAESALSLDDAEGLLEFLEATLWGSVR